MKLKSSQRRYRIWYLGFDCTVLIRMNCIFSQYQQLMSLKILDFGEKPKCIDLLLEYCQKFLITFEVIYYDPYEVDFVVSKTS